MNLLKRLVKTITSLFIGLQPRERVLVLAALIGMSVYGLYFLEADLVGVLDGGDRSIKRRNQELVELNNLLKRYDQLNKRFSQVKATFAKSQMTFEQVTADLDKLVRESIGSANYDLNKTRTPSDIGLEFEKQEFTVRLKSLSLEQLVSLLYKLHSGASPLFLGKLDVIKVATTGDLSASLEVFSIRKKS